MISTTSSNAAQQTGAELSHTVYPACACGHAYGAHACAGWHPLTAAAADVCTCTGYSPNRPVTEFTAVYRPWTTTRGLRRWACLSCWWVEQTARLWRRRWERQV